MNRYSKKGISLVAAVCIILSNTAYAMGDIELEDNLEAISPIVETQDLVDERVDINDFDGDDFEGNSTSVQGYENEDNGDSHDNVDYNGGFVGGTLDDYITGGDFEYDSSNINSESFRFDDPIKPVDNTPVYNSEPFEFFQVDQNSSNFSYGSSGNIDEDLFNEGNEPGAEPKRTKRTIQYTKDINGEYPIYIDTGIEVSEDGDVSINGFKELFRQLSIREQGKVVEDEDQLMLLLNGKIILVKDGVTKLDDIKADFLEGNILIEGQNSRMGGRFDLVEKLERSKELPVIIDEKEIELSVKPAIQDNKVLLPLRDIAVGMGAEVEWNESKAEATITKGDKVLKFSLKSDIIDVNGKKFLISTPTKVRAGENRILSIIRALVVEFDSEMYYDAHKQALVIETPNLLTADDDW